MANNQYFWIVGSDPNGNKTTAGPYASQHEAEDASSHLRNVRIHMLPTRQHDLAMRLLKAKMRGDDNDRMSGDMPLPPLPSMRDHEPEPARGWKGVMDSFMPVKAKEYRED
jgi:hypothetical protein